MKIGASFLLNFKGQMTILEFLEQVVERGLQVAEIVVEPPYCVVGKIDSIERKKIKEFAQKHDLELTIHGPFSDINIGAFNDIVRDFSINEIKKSIIFARDIGATTVTIHPAEFGAIGHSYPDIIKENNVESIKTLTLFAAENDIKIAYENMPIFTWNQLMEGVNPEEMLEIFKNINLPNLGFTWDIGHSNTTTISMKNYYENFKDHLFHVHLHDNDGPKEGWNDTHLEVGKGTVNWQEIFNYLKEMNFQGTLVFELDNWEKIDNSLKYLQRIGVL